MDSEYELIRDYLAVNPSGEHVIPAEFDDLTVDELDRLVVRLADVKRAAGELQRSAREAVLTKAGDDHDGRFAARVGERVYVHRDNPSTVYWQQERELLEFLWAVAGSRAVLDFCTTVRPRSPGVLKEACERHDLDWESFRDTFVSERSQTPRVEVIDLHSPKAPKWAHRLESA